MAQAGNKNIDNASGQDVRLDIQNTVKAVATHNFGSRNSAGTILPCEFLADDDTNKLLIRKSTGGDQANPTLANGNANPDAADFFTVGDLDTENLGLLPKSGGTLTGNLQLPNGTSSAPSLNLGVEEDENGNTVPVLGTGLYRSAVNTLAFTSGGSLKMILNNTAIQLVGTDTSGAKLRFREKNGQGNNFVQFKCPGTLTSNVLLTLPTSLQDNNTAGLRVLKTNSSGVLSFQFVDASDLVGTTLAAGVKNSELESVGTLGSLTVTNTCTAGTFSGSGASLTSLPAAQLTGTIPDARFPSALPAIDGSNLTGISTVPKCESTQLSSTFTNSDNNPLPREDFQTVLSVSINPSSSSVKLLVMITGRILKSGTGSATNNSNAVFRCFEGTTAIGTEVIHGSSSEEGSMSIDQNILRTPNSENTITYHCKIRSSDNDANVKMLAGATLTVLEVS